MGCDRGEDARSLPRADRRGGWVTVAAVVFWVAAGLIVYAHLGYPLVLFAASRFKPRPRAGPVSNWPAVSVIVSAHDEAETIDRWIDAIRGLDYPRRLEVIVVSDGSGDRTAEIARGAGADLVIEQERAGKVTA